MIWQADSSVTTKPPVKFWASISVYSSFLVFMIYFYFFSKTFRMLGAEEMSRFKSTRFPPWRQMLGLLPIALVFFVSSWELRGGLGAWAILQLCWDTAVHHSRLKELKFDRVFERRLLNISYLSGFGIILFFTGMILDVI